MAVVQHELAIIPTDEAAMLRRYMTLERFKSMLEHKALFFCRADIFEDKFEGSITQLEHDFRPRAQREIAAFYGQEVDEAQAQDSIAGLTAFHKQMNRSHVVNCWRINSCESIAMWHLYLNKQEGIAVQTSVQ